MPKIIFHRSRSPIPPVLEDALKLKDISYIHAEGYHTVELKYDLIALLGAKFPVIALAFRQPLRLIFRHNS